MLSILKDFKALLEKEKKILINNDGEQLQEIVKEKEQYLKYFDTGEIPENDQEAARQMIQEIQNLQETNLTLTKQAMSFGQTVLDALQKNSGKQPVTYSKKGKDDGTKGPGLLDQSL